MMRYALITVLLMLFIFISGCNLITPDPAAVMPVEIPDAYVHKAGLEDMPRTGNATMAGGWWPKFGVDELGKLIRTGLEDNVSSLNFMVNGELKIL